MGLEEAKFGNSESKEKKERKERSPKKTAKAKRNEQSQEALSILGYYGINKALVFLATQAATKEIKPTSFDELYEKNPALVHIIIGVAKYFKIPPAMILATLHHESGFYPKTEGDLNYQSGTSIGIGQFQKSAWIEAHTSKSTAYKEFREFIDKFYPGKKFKRGENLLVDIAATAARIKDRASKRIDWKDPSNHRLIQARARYKAYSKSREEMNKSLGKKKGEVRGEFLEFVEHYKMYDEGLKERQGPMLAK